MTYSKLSHRYGHCIILINATAYWTLWFFNHVKNFDSGYCSVWCNFFKGVIRIHVLEARNLEEKDRKILGIGGGSDPFVVVKGNRLTIPMCYL